MHVRWVASTPHKGDKGQRDETHLFLYASDLLARNVCHDLVVGDVELNGEFRGDFPDGAVLQCEKEDDGVVVINKLFMSFVITNLTTISYTSSRNVLSFVLYIWLQWGLALNSAGGRQKPFQIQPVQPTHRSILESATNNTWTEWLVGKWDSSYEWKRGRVFMVKVRVWVRVRVWAT